MYIPKEINTQIGLFFDNHIPENVTNKCHYSGDKAKLESEFKKCSNKNSTSGCNAACFSHSGKTTNIYTILISVLEMLYKIDMVVPSQSH